MDKKKNNYLYVIIYLNVIKKYVVFVINNIIIRIISNLKKKINVFYVNKKKKILMLVKEYQNVMNYSVFSVN